MEIVELENNNLKVSHEERFASYKQTKEVILNERREVIGIHAMLNFNSLFTYAEAEMDQSNNVAIAMREREEEQYQYTDKFDINEINNFASQVVAHVKKLKR